jgi:membrane protein
MRRYSEHQLQQIGGSLAYFFLLSIFPLLIFLNAVLGLFGFALYDVLISIAPLIPLYVFEILDAYILSLALIDSSAYLSIGLIGTIYTASIAVNSIFHAIFRAYNQTNHRNMLVTQGLAIMFTILIGFTLTISLFLPLIGQGFFEFINQYFIVPDFIFLMWDSLRWVLTPLFIMATLALLYRVIPYTPYKQTIWPGTIFATTLWFIASTLFAFYVNQFANFSAVYGSLGAVIALLIWLFLTGVIMILGAELNDILDQMKQN